MSSEVSITVGSLSKSFPVYEKPHHRLFQMLSTRSAKHRWFREFHALENVNFEIHKGETVGIVGRNGSGKSTLLQLLCGTLTPSSGSIEVNGRIAALLELGAGFNPDFTGRENVFLNGTVLGLTRREIEARFDEIAAFADIGEFIEQPVKSYSSGMYVRLAFAVAIHVQPDILVVDEALSVGDEAFQRKCYARIEKIRDDGATVLFVSHSASAVLELCNRAILLDHGQMLAIGAPKTVVSRYQKMLYAPPEMVASIRERFLLEVAASVPTIANDMQIETAGVGEVFSSGHPEVSRNVAGEYPPESYFDPGLVPQSTLRFASHGALIEDPHLETTGGQRVNVLRAGGEFIYTYTAHFQRTATAVRFGMLIKTISGVELGGGVSSTPMESIDVVEAGTTMRICFRFRCLLAPGTYFMNAGISGRIEEVETFLDRLVDAALFRVAHDPDRLATGFVDFHVQPQFELITRQTGVGS
jgi:lipopolysaccharide transport system ATP-binding protein